MNINNEIQKWHRRSLLVLTAIMLFSTLRAQNETPKRGRTFVFPVVTRSLETGWNFGALTAKIFPLYADDTLSRSSNLEVLAMTSTRKQVVFALVGTQYFRNEQFIIEEQISTSLFPDRFWGLGSQTRDDQEENYSFRQTYIMLHGKKKIVPNFFAGIVYEAQKVWDINYVPGGVFDASDIAGKNGYFISGVGGSLSFDNRNNAFAPNKGFYMQLFWNHFDKFWGSEFNYENLITDIRSYSPIGRHSVLAFQWVNFMTFGDQVPLRSLANFGGASKMRGYYEGRFRDRNQMFVQGEIRYPIYKFIQGVCFAGAGSVAPGLKDYSIQQLKYSAGAGLRLMLSKKEKLSLRIDYGVGMGRNRGLYIQLGEAF
ncbi:MAG: BamA/TamA family outer membrane protein [Sediminibacterium sp.]|nr:BamA/TamA family outer membrane protein [Sediminibacterium sp.]